MERVGAEMEWSRLHHKNSQAFVSTLANAHLGLDHRWMIQIHKCKEHTMTDFLDPVPLILSILLSFRVNTPVQFSLED